MVASGQVDRYHGSAMTAKRTRKPAHTNAERAALAARLQATFRKGTPVTAWVRRNHAELTRLTREPEFWSWAELAEVLNATCIRYEAGTRRADGRVSTGLWSEATLKVKVQAGRVAERGRTAAQMPATVEEAARAAVAAVLAELGVQGAAALERTAPDAGEAVRQTTAPPAPAQPPPAEMVRGSLETAPLGPTQPGPLAQAVADQAAHDDRVLAEIRERRRRRATATPGNNHE